MAYQPSEEEMAEMQRLSAAYESEATVCLDARPPCCGPCLHLAVGECDPLTISDTLSDEP